MTNHTPSKTPTAEALLIAIIEADVAVIADRLRASDAPRPDDGIERGPLGKRVKPSAETRAKLSAAAKRRKFDPFSEETRRRMSAAAQRREANRKLKLQSAVSPALSRRMKHG
jgi:hypothetical protein